MMKYTEIYFDDALRLAQFLAERTGNEIKAVEMDSFGFPQPAKNEEFGERTQALVVGEYAIAFFKKRTSPDEDRKHRNRALHRVMFGFKMREAREQADIDLDQLSAYTGVKAKTLENLEKGRFDASVDLIYNIAEALEMDFDFVEKDDLADDELVEFCGGVLIEDPDFQKLIK